MRFICHCAARGDQRLMLRAVRAVRSGATTPRHDDVRGHACTTSRQSGRLQVAGDAAAADPGTVARAFSAIRGLTSLHVSVAAPLLHTRASLAALSLHTALCHLVLHHQPLMAQADALEDTLHGATAAPGRSLPGPGAAFAHALAALSRLKELDVQCCGLDERAALPLALAQLPALRVVTLAHNRLRGAVPAAAAAALALPSIRTIDVSSNGYAAALEPEGSWGDSDGVCSSGGTAGAARGDQMGALCAAAAARGVGLRCVEALPRVSSSQSSRLFRGNCEGCN